MPPKKSTSVARSNPYASRKELQNNTGFKYLIEKVREDYLKEHGVVSMTSGASQIECIL